MKPLFTEKQRFNQWWIWLLLVVSSIAPIIGLYREYINRSSFQNIRLSSFIVLFLVFLLLVILQLKTTITSKSIHLAYFPFVWKTINLADIETMKVVNYGFVGGWEIGRARVGKECRSRWPREHGSTTSKDECDCLG